MHCGEQHAPVCMAHAGVMAASAAGVSDGGVLSAGFYVGMQKLCCLFA